MVQVSYPGVYIQEVPSGVRTITAVATSIAAFVGYFKQGPMNQATEINGLADFERVFGGLHKDSEASYAIDQYFRNGGTKCYVVRVAGSNPKAVPAAITIKSQPDSDGTTADLLKVTAASEGGWGNSVRVRISHNADKTFNLTATRYDGTGDGAKPLVGESSYLNLSMDPDSTRHVAKVVNDASSLIRVEHLDQTNHRLPAATGTLGMEVTLSDANATVLGTDKKTFKIKVNGSKEKIEDHTVGLTWTPPAQAPFAKSLRAALETAIRTSSPKGGGPTDSLLAGATVDVIEDGSKFKFLIQPYRQARAFSPSLRLEITADGADKPAEKLGLIGGGTSINVQDYVLGSQDSIGFQVKGDAGVDGSLPDAVALKGAPGDTPTGMYALTKIDLFNILCIPGISLLKTAAEMDMLVGDILTFCEEQRAFFILDIPPETNQLQEIKDWIDDHSSYRHRNAAVYFPRLKVADPLNEYRLRSIGVSGTVAGIYARTDLTRGVWKAPAGLDAKLRGVSELDVKLTDPENGSINPIAVNAIRIFPVHGQVVWGARTLDGADSAASEWKYISVRRTALMIEESLFRGTKWVVFEPNDEPTWAKVRQNVGAFMMGLFRQGAFQGSTPNDAFYVKCDGETTTANDRNLGIVNIEVGFAALKPAEFVVIKVQQIPDVD